MKSFTIEEALEWSTKKKFEVKENALSFGKEWEIKRFKLQVANLPILDQSRNFVSEVSSTDCLVWLFEWCIFNDLENLWIFSRVQMSFEEASDLNSTPAFLFRQGEVQELTAMVSMIIAFGWDAFLISGAANIAYILRGHEGIAERLSK